MGRGKERAQAASKRSSRARVVVGGMVTSTLTILFLLPVQTTIFLKPKHRA